MTTRRTIEIAAFCAAVLLAALIFHAWLAAHDDQLRLSSTLATQKQALDAADARERDRSASLKDALAQIEAVKRHAESLTPAQLASALQAVLHLPQPITIASPPETSSGLAEDASSAVGARHAVPERPISTDAPLTSNPDQHDTREVRTADLSGVRNPKDPIGVLQSARPMPLPSAATQQGGATNSQQGTGAPLPARNPIPANAARTASQPAAEIPAADLAPLYNYVQDCRACQLQLTAAKQNATDDAAKIRALTRERDAAITAAKGGPFWLRLKRNAHWLAIGAAVGAVTSTAALCHTGHCR